MRSRAPGNIHRTARGPGRGDETGAGEAMISDMIEQLIVATETKISPPPCKHDDVSRFTFQAEPYLALSYLTKFVI